MDVSQCGLAIYIKKRERERERERETYTYTHPHKEKERRWWEWWPWQRSWCTKSWDNGTHLMTLSMPSVSET